ncbi:response regulator transcription factor [Lysinibacillus capsici]
MFNILIVEDDFNTRKLMYAILKHNGFQPYTACDGLEALDIMEQQHLDLVVVDLMMPRLDGYKLTEHIRTIWGEIPIMMVTARHEPIDKKQGFLAGTDDYMTKPVDEEEFILRIKALLRRAKIAKEHQLIVGNTVFNYNALTVSYKNKIVTLPQKEFYLLFKLLSFPNLIFTRIQLMEEFWGIDYESDHHTLNVHISRLRKKFSDNSDFEIITVRGLGYKAVKKDA